jgi:hypothetical protein
MLWFAGPTPLNLFQGASLGFGNQTRDHNQEDNTEGGVNVKRKCVIEMFYEPRAFRIHDWESLGHLGVTSIAATGPIFGVHLDFHCSASSKGMGIFFDPRSIFFNGCCRTSRHGNIFGRFGITVAPDHVPLNHLYWITTID